MSDEMPQELPVSKTPEEIEQARKKLAATQPVIPPNPSVPWFMSSLMREKQEKTTQIDTPVAGEDKILAELATTDAWKYLKRFISGRRHLFGELLKDKVAASPYDMQEIGFRYTVFAQVDDVLGEIINRVENFAQLSKEPEQTGGDNNG